MKRGRPTISVGVRVSTPAAFDPGAEVVEPVVDRDAEVGTRRRRVAGLHQVQLEVAAEVEPDELGRVELRRHGLLREAEQAAVERARLVGAVGVDRDRDVLEPHAPMAA